MSMVNAPVWYNNAHTHKHTHNDTSWRYTSFDNTYWACEYAKQQAGASSSESMRCKPLNNGRRHHWPKQGKVDGHYHVHESCTLTAAKLCDKYLPSLLQCDRQPSGCIADGLHRLTLSHWHNGILEAQWIIKQHKHANSSWQFECACAKHSVCTVLNLRGSTF